MIESPAPAQPKPAWLAMMAFALLLAVVTVVQLAVAAVLAAMHLGELRHALRSPDALGPFLVKLLTTGPGLVASMASTVFCVVGTSLVAARLTGPSVVARLRWGPSALGPAQVGLALLGMLALGQALEGIAAHIDVPSATLEAIGNAASCGSRPVFAALFVFGTFGAGIGEESFFRGYMASVLGERWPTWANILVTSLCFGALHGDPVHSPLAFCLGLYLGWLAERAGSIRPTMLIHGINNAVSFIAARYGSPLDAVAAKPLTIAFALALVAGCVLALRERRAPELGLTSG